MELCTTHKEDKVGMGLLEDMLQQAYEAGKNNCPEEIPNELWVWEKLLDVLGVRK